MVAKKLSSELELFLNEVCREVDHVLRHLIRPNDDPIPNLDDALAYALGLDEEAVKQGKRIRPLLCLLVTHCLGGNLHHAMPFAAAIELMHNFCLVHDDIEDGDEFRRGRPSVWRKYGIPHAINIGDYLFTKIFAALLLGYGKMPTEKVVRFFTLMAATLDHTHRGQALDMNARSGKITIQQYMRIVKEKTGYYLAAPLIAGAIVADASQEIEEALSRYGLFIGPMFQIRDDLIDLTVGKGRDVIGSDIREGKRSFLAAYTFEHASSADQQALLQILDRPREATTDEDVQQALQIFAKCGALKEAERICLELKDNALACLKELPERLRASLEEITEYLAGREK